MHCAQQPAQGLPEHRWVSLSYSTMKYESYLGLPWRRYQIQRHTDTHDQYPERRQAQSTYPSLDERMCARSVKRPWAHYTMVMDRSTYAPPINLSNIWVPFPFAAGANMYCSKVSPAPSLPTSEPKNFIRLE